MSKFIAVSRHATRLDKTRILLETRIQELKDESKKWAEVAANAKEKVVWTSYHISRSTCNSSVIVYCFLP